MASKKVRILTILLAMSSVWLIYALNQLSHTHRHSRNAHGINNSGIKLPALKKTNCGTFHEDEKEALLVNIKDPLNPRLLDLLRCEWIDEPTGGQVKLEQPSRIHFSQYFQSQLVDDLLGKVNGGFFVECGAIDGEYLSNSLFFERSRKWTGLLIEANPHSYITLLKKNRNVYSINTCINIHNTTERHVFDMTQNVGGMINEMDSKYIKQFNLQGQRVITQCFPLVSIIRAVGRKHITLLNLAISGAELGVLSTINFSELTIDVILVECLVHGSENESKASIAEFTSFLENTRLYDLAGVIGAGELVFIRKGMVSHDDMDKWRYKYRGHLAKEEVKKNGKTV